MISMINSSPKIFSNICGLFSRTAFNKMDITCQKQLVSVVVNRTRKEYWLIPLTILNIMWRPSRFSTSSQIWNMSISFLKNSCCIMQNCHQSKYSSLDHPRSRFHAEVIRASKFTWKSQSCPSLTLDTMSSTNRIWSVMPLSTTIWAKSIIK